MAGTSLIRRTGWLLGGGLLTALALGCNTSLDESRYPTHLRYPARQDVLIKEQFKGSPAGFSTPGRLDDHIREAVRKEEESQKLQPGEFGLDPGALDKGTREELQTALREIFGTPARPRVEPPEGKEEHSKLFESSLARNANELGIAVAGIDDLLVDAGTLRRGSQHYRKHCLHCHGLAGDGRGPTGPWVNPHPRDYRLGQFKFISTGDVKQDPKPRRADLHRTIYHGIDGTSMPSFGNYPDADLQEIVSYVIHLSIRGQTEHDVLRQLLLAKGDKSTREEGHVRNMVYNRATEILLRWADSNATEPRKPGDYAIDDNDRAAVQESVRRGYRLFIGKGGCLECHTDFGRQSAYRYDNWGTVVLPRNLTAGVFRGGRRPIDLYWRVAGGIPPSGMPGVPSEVDARGRWDLVNFVRHLSHPAMLPDDVRDKVFRPTEPDSKSSEAHASR